MNKRFIKVISLFLQVVMLIGIIPIAAFSSIANWSEKNVVFDGDKFGTNGYYNVISKKDYTLVPGAAVESEMVINNANGTRRQVMHIIEVDPSNPDISIVPGYYGIDKDLSDERNHTDAGVTKVVEYYENVLGYNVVGAMNTALAYDCKAPYSFLVYNGEVLVDQKNGINNFHSSFCQTMLCVYKNEDGSCYCELRTYSQGLRGDEWQAIGANFAMTVKDGTLVNTNEASRTSNSGDWAARSMIGVKEDGTLVLVMNDGRGANNSVGFSSYELGESMLALGCKWAFNCDGGGSSSFVTKRAGEDKATMRCVPCDGAERATLNSVLIVSNVGKTGVLNAIDVESDYDYFTPNTTYTFGVDATDTHGYAMELPEGGVWSLSDDTFGTIDANGTFTSSGKLGKVTVCCEVEGIKGELTITIANPVVMAFAQDEVTLPYGKSFKLAMNVWADKAGEYPMYYQANSFEWNTTNEDAGTLNMDTLSYTAANNESISKVELTASYKAAEMDALTLTINFGKGCEIIFDFEDGDVSNWLGFEAAKQWSIDNGIENTLVGSAPLDGQYSEEAHGYTSLATRENGQVRNGNYALAWTLDNSSVDFNGWTYNILFYVGKQLVLRDTANGKNATKLGMWLYIPEGATGLAFQSQLFNASGGCKQDHFTFTTVSGAVKNLNSCTEADIPESRWVYVSIDITKYDYLATANVNNPNNSRNPSIVRTYIKPPVPAVHTFYIDDITLDYSSAVDDRVLPQIGEIQYAVSDIGVNADAATITANSASFSAAVSDNEALNAASAQIYIDGNKVKTKLEGGYMITDGNLTMANGAHVVTFEITDMMGNQAQKSVRFKVAASEEKSLIYIEDHNESGTTPLAGSVYFIDVKTSNAANVNTVDVGIKLNNANHWELSHMIIADGFEVEYMLFSADNRYAEDTKKLTFLRPDGIHSTDNVVLIRLTRKTDCELSGEKTLVSIPVRVWTWGGYSGITGESISSVGKKPKVTIDYDVRYGCVAAVDGNDETFSGKKSIVTELDGIVSTWHAHTAVALNDVAATCTHDGYIGRTYCAECSSVVDWGTTVEARHNHVITDGRFVCSVCGDVYAVGTGVFELNGNLYYAIAGTLQKGWNYLDEGVCYADTATYKLVVGEKTIGGITYTFDENGATRGAWFSDNNGTKFSYGPDYYRCSAANPRANAIWVEISGKTYCFDRSGYRHEKIKVVVSSNDPAMLCEFTDDGVYIGEYVVEEDGLFWCNGQVCYLVDGKPIQAGLVKNGNDYYYITSACIAVTGIYHCTYNMTNEVPAGFYEFDAEGKMINAPGPHADGFFYLNGEQKFGWKVYEWNGNYYYVAGYNKYVAGKTVYLDAIVLEGVNLPAGFYEFDAEGKMINVPESLNGPQADGFFYLNGEQKLGWKVYEWNGNYYYVAGYNKYVAGKTVYLDAIVLEGVNLPAGFYEFDAEGKMIIVTEPLNGPQDDGFFYLNNVKQLCYQLIKFEGNYYFIDNYHKYAVNKNMVELSNFVKGTDLEPWYYSFGPDGKMVGYIPGIFNGRDIGSVYYLKTTDGKDIKEGLLIRGSELDGAELGYYQDAGAYYIMEKYSIKTDIDLRGVIAGAKNVLGSNVDHKCYSMVLYEQVFTDEGKAVVKEIFTELANPDNYPIYLHCAKGVDRTGTVSYILEAVLGVPEKELGYEYLLSVGAYGGNYIKIRDGINLYTGATFKDRAEAYLLDCGITQEQINTLRSIYLD